MGLLLGTGFAAASQGILYGYRMPKMSGIDLLQKIQTEQMAIQTILISGYAEFEYAQSHCGRRF